MVVVENCRSKSLHSKKSEAIEFFFAIPTHNASVERPFSLIQTQWTEEDNRLNVEHVYKPYKSLINNCDSYS